MKNNLTKLFLTMLVLMMALALVACGGDTPEAAPVVEEPADTAAVEEVSEPEPESVTIEWIQWFAGSSQEGALEELIAAFEAEYPHINVELVNLPFGEVRNQVITNAAAGQLPDVIGMNPPWMAEFVDMGVLEPLDSYIAAEDNLDISQLVQAPMAKYEGHTWMLPYTASTFVLYYNIDLFEAAGLTAPPTNWAELRDYAAQLTDVEKDQYGFTTFMNEQGPANGSIVILYPLIYAANGRTVVDGVPTINTDAVVQTVQLFQDLHEDGSVVPGTTSKEEVQMVEEFSNGNIGMMIENTAHIGTLANRNPDLNYGLIPIPSVDGSSEPNLRHHGWELGMSARSENKDAAWTFMSWLVSPEANAMIAESSSNIPGNKAADTSFYDDVPQLLTAIDIIANYELVEELMTTPKATAHWQAFTAEMIKMLNGDQGVDDVVANTQAAWEELDQ
jgi:multiple sugar transport system substrate-binding protein